MLAALLCVPTNRAGALLTEIGRSPTYSRAALAGVTILGNTATGPGRVTVRAQQAGNEAFLPVAKEATVTLFDSQVPQFTPTGSWPEYARGPALDVKTVGNIAYVASGAGGVVIWDITDPAKPIHLGGIDTLGVVGQVVLEGNYAYIADSEEGFITIDISDPSHPFRAGHYQTAGSATVFDVAGSYAYVGCTAARADSDVASEGFLILDISEPRFPKRVQNIAFPTNAYYPLFLYRLVATNNVAYVSAWLGGSLLLTYDVSDPAAPKQIVSNGSIPPAPSFTAPNVGGYATRVEVSDGYGYLADPNLEVIDISDPANPSWVSSHEPASSIAISGNLACTVSGPTFRIIDISDKKNLKTIFSSSFAVGGLVRAGYDQVLISGSYVFTRGFIYSDDQGGPRIWISDISNPAAPRGLNSNLYWLYPVGDIAVENGKLYSGGYFSILDVTDPAQEIVLSRTLEHVLAIAVRGNYAYCTQQNGLLIMDVSDPKHPFSAGKCALPVSSPNIRLSGAYAYVFGGSAFHVIDVSDVTKPVCVGSYHDEGEPYDLAVAGDDLFIADGSAGLKVVSYRFGISQNISFTVPKQIPVGDTVTLTASSDSGLPISFTVARGPATLNGASLTVTGPGEVSVRAEQSGNDTTLAASMEVKINSPPVPDLQILSSKSGVTFFWSGNDATLKLEKSVALGLKDWREVVAPIEYSELQSTVRLLSTNQARFYRLRRN